MKFLTDNLFRYYGANPQTIMLTINIRNVKVDINRAILLGLITGNHQKHHQHECECIYC
ncbi:MAG: hypothetical protein NTV10_07935 [Methanoregula sp.]|nr:hypothetical protein [Methanoregula sp.]